MFSIVKNKLTDDLKAYDNQVSFDQSNPLPKRSLGILISAPRGSGKTTLLKTIFDSKNGYKKHFHRIYWISPTALKDEKLNDVMEELIEDGRYYDKYDEEDLRNMITDISDYNDRYMEKHKGSKKPAHCIVIDDCQSDLLNKKNKVLAHLFTCSRHYNITVICSVQRYIGVPMLIRSNCDVFIFFKVKSKPERKRIAEEFDTPEEVLNYCWAEPYSFITINYANGGQEIYKKFDKILL
jgi:Cdc6-like AAA superfamily ATPase